MVLLDKVVILLMIAFPFMSSCQGSVDLSIDTVSFEGSSSEIVSIDTVVTFDQIMTLSDNRSPHPQGGDCWGDLFFQFVTNNTKVRIYDLSSGALVQTVTIPSTSRGFVSNCHCNTVCFGTEFYDVEDEFPLIYVSTGYSSDGYTGALVYRITRVEGVFMFSLVQTIRLPIGESTWTEFVPAGDYAYLCYTSQRVVYKVPLPHLDEGDVVIDKTMATETYQFAQQPNWMASSRNQDRLFYKDKIYLVSGVPEVGEASVLIILNLEEQIRETIIDLRSIGLKKEPESIFFWQGSLCIAFMDQIVRLNI